MSRSRPTGGSCVERKDIDAIDICTPNNTHDEIAIAAAEAGKMILCEKPLSMDTGRRRRRCVEAVEKAGVPNTVWYNYRRVPAVTLAKQLIDEGSSAASSTTAPTSCRTGRSPSDLPQGGRGSGGSTRRPPAVGVTGDLLAHCIDTALWLNGGSTTSRP